MRNQVEDEGGVLIRTPANLDAEGRADDRGEINLAIKASRGCIVVGFPTEPRPCDKKQRIGLCFGVVDAVFGVAHFVRDGQISEEVWNLEEPGQARVKAKTRFAGGLVRASLSYGVEAIDGLARLEIDDHVCAVLLVRLVGLMANWEVDGSEWNRGTGACQSSCMVTKSGVGGLLNPQPLGLFAANLDWPQDVFLRSARIEVAHLIPIQTVRIAGGREHGCRIRGLAFTDKEVVPL